MAGVSKDTRSFFSKGTTAEWEYTLTFYRDALKLKSQQKKKPEELIKLDSWYQDELPKLIQARKEKHVTHDELVQTMKWKLMRGKFQQQMTNLVKMNTPAAVMQASKKAFKKAPKRLSSAIRSLTMLKGVGMAMASAVLAAGAPEIAPFMADECLMSIPDMESVDYTLQEYVNFTRKIQNVVERLNAADKNGKWNPHRVELALWTRYVVAELNPTLLESIPREETQEPSSATIINGDLEDSNDLEQKNGGEKRSSVDGDCEDEERVSQGGPRSGPDGEVLSEEEDEDDDDSTEEPSPKKCKTE